MKYWLFALFILMTSACTHATSHDSANNCGTPILNDKPVGCRVAIDSELAALLQRQLPGDVAVDDLSWKQMPDGRLEGSYFTLATDKRHNLDTYILEFRD